MSESDDSEPTEELQRQLGGAGGALPTTEAALVNELAESDPQGGTAGRLVSLRRSRDGAYQILMRDRVIQGFCLQFEDITGWRQPRDTQMQARISIVPIGRLRVALYPEEHPDPPHDFETERVGRDDSVQRRLMPDGINAVPTGGDDGVQLESIAHPVPWQVEALAYLREERDHTEQAIEMIESLRRR